MNLKVNYLKLLSFTGLINRKNYNFKEETDLMFSKLHHYVKYDDGTDQRKSIFSFNKFDYIGNFYLHDFLIYPYKTGDLKVEIRGFVYYLKNSKILKLTVKNESVLFFLVIPLVFLIFAIFFLEIEFLYFDAFFALFLFIHKSQLKSVVCKINSIIKNIIK